MSPTGALWLVVMGLVFAVWVLFAFRTLFRLLRISLQRRAAQNAGYFGWVMINFGVFRDFLVSPEHRRDRRLMIGLTLLMFAVQILHVVLWVAAI